MRQKKTFKVTRLKLSDLVKNSKDRMDIESLFLEFETQRQISVEKHRKAVQAQAEAQQAQLDMQRSHQALLLKVSEFSSEVANEPVWFVFRKDNDIHFESPFGERTQRNLIRAQLAQLDSEMRNREDASDADLYEDSDDGNSESGNASSAN